WTCGAVHIGIDHELTAPELCEALDLSQAKLLLHEPPGASSQASACLEAVSREHPDLPVIVSGDPAAPGRHHLLSSLTATATGDADLPEAPAHGPSPRDPAII